MSGVTSKNLLRGQLYSCNFADGRSMFEWIDTTSQSKDDHLVFVSRLPHRRLLDRIDVSKVETYWMTHRVGQAHIAPDLEQIHDLILSRISNHHGCIILEGLEWLVTLHGETVMLNFVRSLRDDLHRTQWSILIPIKPLAFNSIWLARFHREAPEIDLEIEGHNEVEIHVADEIGEEQTTNSLSTEEGLPILVMLNRLPEIGFTKPILRKRILQWRRMGLDVSEVEPALHLDSAESYELYAVVEEKVRRAGELEHLVDATQEHLTASEQTTCKFRIRQLTGLDEIQAMLMSR